ncbi:HPP family protein [Enterovibrio nigricans]|uniref:HPP family protein n=1 Tax=Enterovibrio nigricans DSM 22720 TaxID=1121868 RepID=A0A1T4UN31_9GAMM|nr:HPP family protein [Enterovibrio nigricans]PKF50603.1 HPP family protein [Enterovibrio nigricans]SKA54124.1 HPP family protein [Enterovibrio nigricans DSM 22720]
MSDESKGIYFRILRPAQQPWMIALVAAIGASLCIGMLAFIDQTTKGDYALIAPFGATMVLVFGLPQSPLAQPPNVVFGHLTTAIVGICFANIFPPEYWALGIAVGTGIFFMIILKVTHPPAGGNPILIMLGGHTSFTFALYPVLLGSCLIVIIALVYHGFISRAEYAWVNKVKKE